MDKIQRFQLKKILKNFGTAINGTGLILLFNNDQIIIFDTQGKAEQKDWKKVKYIKVKHVDNENHIKRCQIFMQEKLYRIIKTTWHFNG